MEQYTAGEIIFVLETFLSFPKIEVYLPPFFVFNLYLQGEAVSGRGAEDVEQHRADHHLGQQGCGHLEEIGEAKKVV